MRPLIHPAVRTSAFLVLLLAPAPARLAAQTFTAALGATASTRLLHDQIVSGIDVQPKVAPTLNLRAEKGLAHGYGINAELGITSGGLKIRENGVSRDFVSLRTVSLTGGADGRFILGTRWRLGVGAIKYFPSRHEGLFLQGGPTEIIGGAGLDYSWKVRPRFALVVAARYDYHRFTTAELKSRGFFRTENVHRVALTFGISWLKS